MVHSTRTRADQRSFELNETEFSRFVKSKRNYDIKREVTEEQVFEKKVFSSTEVAREALQESIDAMRLALESAHIPEKLEKFIEGVKHIHLEEQAKKIAQSVQDAHVGEQLSDVTEHIKQMSKVFIDTILHPTSEPSMNLKELARPLPHSEFTVEERDLPKHHLSKAERILGEDLSNSSLYTADGLSRKIPIQELETVKVTTLELDIGKVTQEDIQEDINKIKQAAYGLLESSRHLVSDTVEILGGILTDRKADYESSKEIASEVLETLQNEKEPGIKRIDDALNVIDKSLSGKTESEDHMDEEKFDEVKKMLEFKLSITNKNKTIDDSDHMGVEKFEQVKESLEQRLELSTDKRDL